MNINKRNKKHLQGFTLIELLIVVALLGAMAAIMLPSLTANRTKAMEATCDYNQAATIKTLNDHVMLQGTLPDNLHTGTEDAVDATYALMDLPGENGKAGTTVENMTNQVAVVTLTEPQVASLEAAGIKHLTYGDGSNNTAVAGALPADATDNASVLSLTGWMDDAGDAVTFNAKTIANLQDPDGVVGNEDDGIIIPLFITPATDWDNGDEGWGAEVDAKVGVKKVGVCKVPTDKEFCYYIAYIKAFDKLNKDGEGIPAELVGTSCPECGITNP